MNPEEFKAEKAWLTEKRGREGERKKKRQILTKLWSSVRGEKDLCSLPGQRELRWSDAEASGLSAEQSL